ADHADGEQQRGQQQVVGRGHFDSSSSCASADLPATSARALLSASSSASVASRSCLAISCAVVVDSIRSDSDSGATRPSGSSAGVATELEVANTPGPGNGVLRLYSPRNRASTSSFCDFFR